MNRNKAESMTRLPGSVSASSTPIKKISNTNIIQEEKSTVGDLITLETEPVVFDPLLLDNQRNCHNQNIPNPHKKLERAPPIQNGDVRKYSQGKYENFVPLASAQKEFLTGMTDNSRTSDDVKLNEYGINFSSMSIARQLNTGPVQPPPVPPRASNSSFLHNSASPYIPSYTGNNSSIPVNNRISSVGHQNSNQQTRDIFADLDPLGSAHMTQLSSSSGHPASGSAGHPSVSSPLPPPMVPPRTKKQWTTFD